MGSVELVLAIVLIVLVLQLFLSFIPGLDQRVVGIVIVLVLLAYFGHRGRYFASSFPSGAAAAALHGGHSPASTTSRHVARHVGWRGSLGQPAGGDLSIEAILRSPQ